MRQYIASNLPDKNGQLSITGKDFKYLCQVLRLSVGDVIQVRLPNQELVNMQVFKLQSKQIILVKEICDCSKISVESTTSPRFTIKTSDFEDNKNLKLKLTDNARDSPHFHLLKYHFQLINHYLTPINF